MSKPVYYIGVLRRKTGKCDNHIRYTPGCETCRIRSLEYNHKRKGHSKDKKCPHQRVREGVVSHA